jgi:SpoVK/Ycf46/Vps4 family AAA+-type ATPase
VHVLLYGSPGSGKSSFAAALAAAMGQKACFVRTEEGNSSRSRRVALEACFNMTSSGREALVVADEADNLLNTAMSFYFTGETQDKGWLNGFLEQPGSRAVWICNDIQRIEASVLRRFAFSVHFHPLSPGQRQSQWDSLARKNKVKSLLRVDEIARLAHRFDLSTGSVDLAMKSSLAVAGRRGTPFRAALERSLDNATALLHGGHAPRREDRVSQDFSLHALRLDCDPAGLLETLRRFDAFLERESEQRVNMNLLFHGPPGTGKTELSRHLARELGREVLVRRGSDLLDKYVGQTEKAVAAMFRQAEQTRALLVVDEADGFLFDRAGAHRSWESSMVNEFLTRMEHFRGILVCTTNRLDALDAASLRRFNRKVHFGFLLPAGIQELYARMLAPLAGGQLERKDLAALCRLRNLTPGDFKVVRDRYRFLPRQEVAHRDMVQDLTEESRLKAELFEQGTIGF